MKVFNVAVVIRWLFARVDSEKKTIFSNLSNRFSKKTFFLLLDDHGSVLVKVMAHSLMHTHTHTPAHTHTRTHTYTQHNICSLKRALKGSFTATRPSPETSFWRKKKTWWFRFQKFKLKKSATMWPSLSLPLPLSLSLCLTHSQSLLFFFPLLLSPLSGKLIIVSILKVPFNNFRSKTYSPIRIIEL